MFADETALPSTTYKDQENGIDEDEIWGYVNKLILNETI